MWRKILVSVGLAALAAGPLGGADEAARLEPLTVLGTRAPLAGADVPDYLPVIRFDRVDIERSGAPVLQNLLRGLPWMSGNLTYVAPVALTGAQTTLDFRGLGTGSTLILLNGRRISPSGQSDGRSLIQEIGNLPAAAIESIEILRDGASALYGSDAVAGVMNVRLRRSFDGVSTTFGYAQMEGTDWSRRTFSATAGGARGPVRAVVIVDGVVANSVRFGDRPLSYTEDMRRFGGQDYRQNFGFPGQLTLPAGTPGVPAELLGGSIALGTRVNGLVTLSPPTSTPTVDGFVRLPGPITNGLPTPGASVNNFDRAPWTDVIPEENALGGYASFEWAFADAWTAFAELGLRRRTITSELHPAPASIAGESGPGKGDGPGGAIVFPASNPYNPFGVDITNLRFHLVELGPRRREFTNTVPRAVLGVRSAFGTDWSWELAGLYTHDTVDEAADNQILDRDLQAGLAGRLGGYINPFGPSDPGVMDRARSRLETTGTYRTGGVDTRVAGTLPGLPAGRVRVAGGAEFRRDRYRAEPAAETRAGGFVAWSALPEANVARTSSAVFAEAVVPLARGLEVQVAARGEWSNDFGTTAKPKFAASWRPLPWLLVRGSRAESFRAPELLELYLPQTTITAPLTDPLRPDLGAYGVQVITGGNPDLQPEEGTSDLLAVAVEPFDGVRLTVSRWKIRKRSVSGTLGANFILANESNPDASTASRVVRFPSVGGVPGEIRTLYDQITNIAQQRTDGWDVDLEAKRDFGAYGTWTASAYLAFIESYEVSTPTGGSVELASIGRPKVAGQASLACEAGRWTVSWFSRYTGPYDSSAPVVPGVDPNVEAHWTHNATLACRLGEDVRVALAVGNVLDEDPPQAFGSRGYDLTWFDNFGRTWTVTADVRF